MRRLPIRSRPSGPGTGARWIVPRGVGAACGLLAVIGTAAAGDLQRCIVDGEVLFTDTACPDQTRGQPVTVETPRLGNLEDAGRVRREADKLWLYKRGKEKDKDKDEAAADAAPARPTSLDVINAIRRRQLLNGMTPDEVREAWGPPNSVTEGSDGGTAWTYRGTDQEGNKRSRRVRFTDGVVDGWSGTRTRTSNRYDPEEGRWLD